MEINSNKFLANRRVLFPGSKECLQNFRGLFLAKSMLSSMSEMGSTHFTPENASNHDERQTPKIATKDIAK